MTYGKESAAGWAKVVLRADRFSLNGLFLTWRLCKEVAQAGLLGGSSEAFWNAAKLANAVLGEVPVAFGIAAAAAAEFGHLECAATGHDHKFRSLVLQ